MMLLQHARPSSWARQNLGSAPHPTHTPRGPVHYVASYVAPFSRHITKHNARPFVATAATRQVFKSLDAMFTNSKHRTRPNVATAATKQVFKSFDDMIANSDGLLIIDFYATWCGPCQMMSQVLNEVSSREIGSQVQFVKIDTEKYPAIASRHNVQGLPTLVLFKDGQPVDRIEGFVNAQQLEQRLRYFLS